MIGFVLAQLPMAAVRGADNAALADAMFESPAFLVLLLLPMLAMTMVGMPLLLVAARRVGLAPLASVVLLVAAFAVDMVEIPAPWGGAAFHALLAAAVIPVARRLLAGARPRDGAQAARLVHWIGQPGNRAPRKRLEERPGSTEQGGG